jgi:hypothetical protein
MLGIFKNPQHFAAELVIQLALQAVNEHFVISLAEVRASLKF